MFAEVNPAEWDSRLKFWAPLIANFMQERAKAGYVEAFYRLAWVALVLTRRLSPCSQLLFNVNDIETAFQRRTQVPKGIAK